MSPFKFILSAVIMTSLATAASTQVYPLPDYKDQNLKGVTLEKIELTPKATIVHMVYTHDRESDKFMSQTWICAMESFHIVDPNGKKHYIENVRNIPMCPGRKYVTRPGQKVKFQLYFPPIELPGSENFIDIIEEDERGFSFYKVKLVLFV